MKNKKIIASFELVIIITSLFAFAHGIYLSDGKIKNQTAQISESKIDSKLETIINTIFEKINEPTISIVSASEYDNKSFQDLINEYKGGELIENETWISYEISSNAIGSGCCFISKDGQKCGTAIPENCVDDSPFAEGALCSNTAFCKKGCCFSEESGIYDSNVLKIDCPNDWADDQNCNMPKAKNGCCVLGSNSFFITRGQCEVRTAAFAEGQSQVVDWRGELGEMECSILSASQNEGACVLPGRNCEFNTEEQCYSLSGQFNEGYLCSSPSLNTSCGKTTQTTCVDGKEEVYFADSCGNKANIYDSSKVNDITYWDRIIEKEDSCGSDDVDNGNANSENCGNCNRFAGGICASATEDNFDVDIGNFYCKDTSCMVNGERYKNGESWCAYDGKIGDGDDVVGSRHWKYICSQGVSQIEPCADYRNEICIQSNTFDISGDEIEFRKADCVANNWRECINLNGEDDGIEKCTNTLNCRIEKVNIADKFDFNICLPKYPGGFNLRDERYEATAKQICGLATQSCTFVQKPKFWGGCEDVANRGCLSEGFAQKMNDFCRGMGDCGGSVNILGEYSKNYKVKNSQDLSQNWINRLKELSSSVDGQLAEVEDYSEYLEAAGIVNNAEEPGDIFNEEAVNTVYGVGGIGLALRYAAGGIVEGEVVGGLVTSAETSKIMAGFSGAMIGASVGAIAGAMLAKSLSLSPAGAILMATGGALMGGALGYWMIMEGAKFATIAPFFWIGVGLIVLSLFFGGDDCDPIKVEFKCKLWQPPRGGDDCNECNNDPLKPCSEYRCDSLGASCEIINKGTSDEMCINARANDTTPPILSSQFGIFPDGVYSDISDNGFSITSINGGCLDAYEKIVLGITTNEPAQCKFDIEIEDFIDMQFDLGGNSYIYNHTTFFKLPDPSHGQSQGLNWTGDLNLYIKCIDTNGHESPGFYTVDMCVKEGEDMGAPIIKATNPADNIIVGFDSVSEDITIVTNEFATCKWDSIDKEYSLMQNPMNCNDTFRSPSNPLGYVCKDTFPITNISNIYYIRCMDQPWLNESINRNANKQSFAYTLRKPEAKIKIDWIKPNQSFEINTDMTTIELKIQTSSGGEGHLCSWSFSGYERMIEMFPPVGRIHSQTLDRPTGNNKIYVECSDETGDSVQGSTEFEIIKDVSTPQIARVWQVNNKLYVITTESAECKYSTETCKFNWADAETAGIGEKHIINVVRGKTYHIKCEDEFGNVPSGCSIEAKIL